MVDVNNYSNSWIGFIAVALVICFMVLMLKDGGESACWETPAQLAAMRTNACWENATVLNASRMELVQKYFENALYNYQLYKANVTRIPPIPTREGGDRK
jgi:hypothetical protein